LLVRLDGEYPLRSAHEAVRTLSRDAGIPFLDLLPVLAGRRAQSLWVHPVDRHPNELAQRLVAAALAATIERLERH
jgi:hypothetical protein